MFHISLTNTKSENRDMGKKTKVLPFSIFSRNKYIFRLVFVPKLEIAWSSREMFKVQDFEVIRDKYQGASLALFRFLVRFHKFHSYIPSIFYFLEPNSPCFCCTSLDVCTVLSQGIQMDRSGCSPSIWAKMPKERDVEHRGAVGCDSCEKKTKWLTRKARISGWYKHVYSGPPRLDVIELLDYLHGFSLVALLQGVRGWHVNAAPGKTARIQPSLCHSAAKHEETQQVFEEQPGGLLQRARNHVVENCPLWIPLGSRVIQCYPWGISNGKVLWEFLKNFAPLELLRLGQQSTEFHDFVGSSMARLTTFCAPCGTSMIFLNIINPMAVSRQYSKICIYSYIFVYGRKNTCLSF